jgi:aminopeptidase N
MGGTVKPVVDPYTPHSGNTGYRVRHHDLDLDYRVASNRLTATATLSVDVHDDLDRIAFDLHGMTVDGVRIDGTKARKVTTSTHKLVVTPAAPLRAGTHVTVVVRYRGAPHPVRSPWGTLGWEELTDGVIVASQPVGAPSWFPCNDLPGQKATYRIAVTCEADYTVVANGTLTDRATTRGGTRWTFDVAEPMATYLATVQIGRYRTTVLPGAPVPTTVHHPADLQTAVRTDLGRVPAMLRCFVERFGPYPFPAYGVVVTDDELEIPLEAHGLAVFGRNHIDGEHGTDRLIAHELAHQWFGNSLTAGRWRDIWLHEGFACYAEWLWAETEHGVPASVSARLHRERLAGEPADIVVADPGAADMFDDRVYKRGALALHAVRSLIGDAAFFAGLRGLAAAHRHATVSTDAVVTAFVAAVHDHPATGTAGGAEPGTGTTDVAAGVRAAIGAWVDRSAVPTA